MEDCLSARAIQRDYKLRTGAPPDVAGIAAESADNEDATAVFIDFGRHLGLALRTTLAEFGPQVVVIDGGISRPSHLFLLDAVNELEGMNMQLCVSTLLDRAALAGAAVAWFNGSNGAHTSSPHPAANVMQNDAN